MQKLKNIAYGATSAALLLAPTMAGAQWDPTGGRYGAAAGGPVGTFGLPATTFTGVISTAILWLLAILGFLAIIAFVIAGILYLTAAGDEGQIEKAKSTMTYAIIGLIVALVGWMIVQAVSELLRANTGRGL